MRSGLLRQASVELGEHLSMQPSSTERSRGGWLVRPLSRVGSSVYRVRSPIDLRLAVTVPPRRFGAERRDDAVDEINSSRASDARQRADNRTVIELQAKRHEIDTTACSSLTQSEFEPANNLTRIPVSQVRRCVQPEQVLHSSRSYNDPVDTYGRKWRNQHGYQRRFVAGPTAHQAPHSVAFFSCESSTITKSARNL